MIKTSGILIEILYNVFSSVAQQMAYTLQRTAYTVYVKYTCDMGTGLLTKNGEMFAYGYPLGVAVYCAGNGKVFIESFPEHEYQEGDIVISNDPYTTGGLTTHLPDIQMIKPIFHRGELICFAWSFIHASDVGGAAPGSVLLSNSEIWQEGLRIPPLKLYKAGKLNEQLLKIYQMNSRIPDDNWGDLQAMVSALNVGESRFKEILEKYGVETIKQSMEDVL